MNLRSKRASALVLAIGTMVAAGSATGTASPGQRADERKALTIDNVLATEHVEAVVPSPDGEWVAVAVRRGAGSGEVYGRTSYDLDPSRSDISLISTRTGERRAITDGRAKAAGYWCPTWSPDGRRLAMLSTQPEGSEPAGGNNVRLYLWQHGEDRPVRMGGDAILTQTRAGSPLHKLDLRGGGDGGTAPRACHEMENAPFLWLDNDRLLVVTLPKGQVSGLIDQYGRSFRVAARNGALIRDGVEPTVHAVGSGEARAARDDADQSAVLQIVDAADGTSRAIASVPAYPFRGALSVTVSPDLRRLAVVATLGALQPLVGRTFLNAWDDGWTVERRLGFVDLEPGAVMRWVDLPDRTRLPLELFDWSPDSRHVAVRGRPNPFSNATALVVVRSQDSRVVSIGGSEHQVAAVGVRTRPGSQIPVIWADNRTLIARLRADGRDARDGWWLLGLDGRKTELATMSGTYPDRFVRVTDGGLRTVVDNRLFRLDMKQRALVSVAPIDDGAWTIWPQNSDQPTDTMLAVVQSGDARGAIRVVDANNGTAGRTYMPSEALNIVGFGANGASLISKRANRDGIAIGFHDLEKGKARDLLALNGWMADTEWGATRFIDYQSTDGKSLKGAVILPPNYQPGRRYPMLMWVYQGYTVSGHPNEQWFDPYLNGFYNLQLYAANGYVVLVPSMPMDLRAEGGDVYRQVLAGTMPAIDKLVELGIADPDRVGVFGQSRGGYTVTALLGQTNRFKAGVAMASVTDLTSLFGEFDPTSRGYPGIGHEKSRNSQMIGQFGLKALSGRDDAYARNSPLAFADRVETPLLMVHGEADVRGAETQSELLFYSLYTQGKTAKLLRYGGESHGLSQSPANIRDIFQETLAWFDRYLGSAEKARPTQ